MPAGSGRHIRPPATRLQGGCTAVRGFRRGNNANNTNMSPLYVNGNNAPSNTNSNIAFGNWKPEGGPAACKR